MRRHEDTLAKAVDEAEMSTFRVALRHNIDKAKALLATLQDIEITCHSVLNLEQKTISEIANFASPPKDVHFTMIATYLLLGEKKQHLKVTYISIPITISLIFGDNKGPIFVAVGFQKIWQCLINLF
ncbi:hypothetical protein DPMN_121059 [Dreissena polymorpha]|uniref:Uncharacterized protein n=1 Tax=Dreissena polymorpha TaxID=45954 RepID=A0A9D4GPU1_DREPO|nr:hypothetical protein DPMN_121059 [Dreissena polymorpha]